MPGIIPVSSGPHQASATPALAPSASLTPASTRSFHRERNPGIESPNSKVFAALTLINCEWLFSKAASISVSVEVHIALRLTLSGCKSNERVLKARLISSRFASYETPNTLKGSRRPWTISRSGLDSSGSVGCSYASGADGAAASVAAGSGGGSFIAGTLFTGSGAGLDGTLFVAAVGRDCGDACHIDVGDVLALRPSLISAAVSNSMQRFILFSTLQSS